MGNYRNLPTAGSAKRGRRKYVGTRLIPILLTGFLGLSVVGASVAGASGGSVAAARKLATAALVTPAKLSNTTPLTSKPKKQTIVWLMCENQACKDQGAGLQAAAKVLGWNFKQVNYLSSDSSTLITAMRTALQYHPLAVALSGIGESEWLVEEKAYAAAGVKIIPTVTTANISATVPVVIGNFSASGRVMGDYFVANSNGNGGAVIVNLPAFPVLTQYAGGVQAEVKANCPNCQTSVFNGTFTQLVGGQFVPGIVTALKENPTYKYVIVAADLLTPTLPSALKTAGLGYVKILGGQPDPSDIVNIQTGTEVAATNLNNILIGWEIGDAAARISEHMRIPGGDGGVPFQLLTKANLTQGSNINRYAVPTGFIAKYKVLWHVR
jgi:hypothetical protein